MRNRANYATNYSGFDFAAIWGFVDGQNDGFPVLRVFYPDSDIDPPTILPTIPPTTPPTEPPTEQAPNPDDAPKGSIDYSTPDLTVPGSVSGFSINLTQETITIPATYSPTVYSVDGGAKWKPVKDALSDAKFQKLLSKDLTLHLSDEPIDKTTKKPGKDATIVIFPKINARPTAPAMAVNYAVAEDKTGYTGW